MSSISLSPDTSSACLVPGTNSRVSTEINFAGSATRCRPVWSVSRLVHNAFEFEVTQLGAIP